MCLYIPTNQPKKHKTIPPYQYTAAQRGFDNGVIPPTCAAAKEEKGFHILNYGEFPPSFLLQNMSG